MFLRHKRTSTLTGMSDCHALFLDEEAGKSFSEDEFLPYFDDAAVTKLKGSKGDSSGDSPSDGVPNVECVP